MNRKARDVELPFAPSLKRVLSQSGAVADSFESSTVNSEHVLLALLGYDAKTGGVPTEVDEDAESRGYAKGALAVFLRMEGTNTKHFRASEFCRRLIMDIKYPDGKHYEGGGNGDGDGDGDEGPQLVTGNDQASETPTLKECGQDLTEAARNGELDPVFGRDDEIRAALRTLVRRRKNNPCLTGEPGVGKVSEEQCI